ncbi:ankyrin repeat domain-containing protein 29-like [Littorina saxatilis]|uniref:Uncharacterized protein n=1 Tax=Littorina saxatilis TaxID=31220 RepID=A0AAN9AP62_9CAEN
MGNIINFIINRVNLIANSERRRQHPEQIDFRRRAFHAARRGDTEALQELAELSRCSASLFPLGEIIDPETGYTLLHAAMEQGGEDCVRFLIDAGCEIMRGDGSNETPLHVACMHNNTAGLRVALAAEERVDLEVTDVWQRTPLLKAMVYNSRHVLHMLLNLHVNLNAQDIDGLSLAHLAARHGHVDLLCDLAEKGADLNLLNDRARTPLSYAITACNPDVVRQLLIFGASTHNPKSGPPVVTAVSELIRRFEGGVMCERAEQVLHLMLAAHGYPLHLGEPDVFQRVLYTADVKRFLPLLHKMHICSDCPYSDLFMNPPTSLNLLPQQGRRNSGNQQRTHVTLFDLARRCARRTLMASGRNVMWAVERLGSSVPPAVKGILMLKDCDHKDFPQ